ncbi:major facilitator superfamily domain-containing protein [Lasiosphaeris hirsuta]|uniref:Major facilitator superfamily domain-containing protein n=1 Tax=Lasiosphaeris hirsuta TaxID=260670 RepID=A0AA40E301_9PEZI|nr:major facilitator superfamily domain-containing protein [Lasiosphaeris hirsuta]
MTRRMYNNGEKQEHRKNRTTYRLVHVILIFTFPVKGFKQSHSRHKMPNPATTNHETTDDSPEPKPDVESDLGAHTGTDDDDDDDSSDPDYDHDGYRPSRLEMRQARTRSRSNSIHVSTRANASGRLDLTRTISRRETILSRIRSRPPGIYQFTHPLSHIPTSKDQLVDFDGPDDPYRPMNWPMHKKVVTTMLYGLVTMTATWASSCYSAGTRQVAEEFGVGLQVAVLGTSLFLVGFGIGPLLWAPLSEVYGRRVAVFVPMFIAICFSFGSATAKDFQTLMITRFFCAFFASAPVTNTGGVLGDLYSPTQRGIVSVVELAKKFLVRPVQLLCTPICFLVALYASFCYGILYMQLGAIPIIFGEILGWSPVVSTMPFLCILIGAIFGCCVNVYNQTLYNKVFHACGNHAVPESRLPPMMVGSVVFAAGQFVIGWTARPDIHWIAPCIGLVMLGTGFFTIFQAALNYLVDTFTMYAASAVAANTFLRSCFACAFPLVVTPMYHNIGVGPASSITGGFAALLIPVPFVFYTYGKRIRARSKWSKGSVYD